MKHAANKLRPAMMADFGVALAKESAEKQSRFLLAYADSTWAFQRDEVVAAIKAEHVGDPAGAATSIYALRELAVLILEELE